MAMDLAWSPACPPGHTPFTWEGELATVVDRQVNRQDRQADRQAERQADRQTERQTGKELCEGIVMQECGDRGRLLVATRTFDAGEQLLVDTPLLLSSPLGEGEEGDTAQELAEAWAAKHTGLPILSFLHTLAFLKGVCVASKAKQRGLDDFYAPVTCPPQLRPFVEVAEACASFAWAKGVSVEDLRRAVLVCKCNAHAYGSHTAVFPLGSKMNHSCDNNTFYSTTLIDGKGVWVALRRITCGEELTHAYIDKVYPAMLRQKHLQQQFNFTCGCRLCTEGLDMYRALPCPACRPRSGPTVETPHTPPLAVTLLAEDSEEGEQKKGHIRRDLGTGRWSCDQCAQTYGDGETGVPEAVEVMMQATVEGLEASSPGLSPDGLDERQLMGQWLSTRRVLGDLHWATKRLEYLLCRHYTSQIFLSKQALYMLLKRIESLWAWLAAPAAYLEPIVAAAAPVFLRYHMPGEARKMATRAMQATELAHGRCTHTHIHTHTHTNTRTQKHTYTHAYIHTHIHTHTHIRTLTHTHTHTHTQGETVTTPTIYTPC
jgi:hypothetical protein